MFHHCQYRDLQPETEPSIALSALVSEIGWLTNELSQAQKRAAELRVMLAARYAEETRAAAMFGKLTKEPIASLAASPRAYIDTLSPSASPVAADTTNTTVVPEAGAAFLTMTVRRALLPYCVRDATAEGAPVPLVHVQ